jgi:phospholipid/cholesterol/gamma-HCH transport system permease protein
MNESNPIELLLDKADATINLSGRVTLDNAGPFSNSIKSFRQAGKIKNLTLDCSKIETYDSYLVAYIMRIRKVCLEKHTEINIIFSDDNQRKFVELLELRDSNKELTEDRQSAFVILFTNAGKTVYSIFNDMVIFLEFIGEMLLKILSLFVHPGALRWKDLPVHFSKAGVNAVPIVTLILLLIGLITGYQGALQLQQFGADIYIANLIGISITRELAPLMTAILVAGRSGSAFTAEIGTMKVSEEIDALSSMGYGLMNFLVLPRVFAVVIAMPILTLIADVAGILGGLIAAVSTLNITMAGYMNQMQVALNYYHVFSGVGKSIVFGFLIASVGCFRGMQVSGGAESVGKYTTISVVTSLFLIILFDAIFTYIFQLLGI